MSSCKKIFIAGLLIVAALSSCMEQKIIFDFNKDITRNFFREIPGLGSADYVGQPVTQKANKIEVYLSAFREKYIEKGQVLEYTELNDSTTIPFVTYKQVDGYHQDLYLLKYEFTYVQTNKTTGKSFAVPTQAAIFFSVKYNGRGNALGIMPCYFGIINVEDDLIAFDTELSLKKDRDNYYLKLQKRNKRINGLMFMPADFPLNPKNSGDIINIKKIVRLDPNKVGGYKPLVFEISKIFHDSNALQFHFYDTLHLTQ